MSTQLRTYLDSLVPRAPKRLGPITLLPLAAPPSGPEVALLEPDAARIREHARGARMRSVLVESLVPTPLLLLAGEVLEGAMQDRLVNATTLVPPGGEVDLKVSCVEQGRWGRGRGDGRRFTSRGRSVPWKLRSRHSRRASVSKRRGGEADPGQGEVWRDVDEYLDSRGVRSRTGALTEGIERVRVEEVLGGWSPEPDEVGAALFLGAALVGFEAFGCPEAWRVGHRRVLSGLAFEAPEDPEAAPDEPGRAFAALLDRLRGLDYDSTPGEGEGTELHGGRDTEYLVALFHDGGMVHVRGAVLAEPEEPRRRRRRRPPIDMERLRSELRSRRSEPGSRHAERLDARDERAQAIYRVREVVADASPTHLVFTGWFLLMKPEAASEALYHSIRDTDGPRSGLPLPHTTARGLAAWEAPTSGPLVSVASLLSEYGLSEAEGDWVLAHAGALHDTPLPGWVRVEPRQGDGVRVARTGSE